jgi:hypothetical protein
MATPIASQYNGEISRLATVVVAARPCTALNKTGNLDKRNTSMQYAFIASALTLSLASLNTFAINDGSHSYSTGVKQHGGHAAPRSANPESP